MSNYNGWSNYPTWRIYLELVGDYVEINGAEMNMGLLSVPELAQDIENMVDDLLVAEAGANSIALDYARAFVSDCDWFEMAEAAYQVIHEDD
jgi:hypothetical protein